MFFDNLTVGRQRFHSEVERIATEIAKEYFFSIRYKRSLIDSAYASAVETLNFHGIEPGQTNHFKQLAHLAFWICRFKPLRLEPPKNLKSILEDLAKEQLATAFGEGAYSEPDFQKAQLAFNNHLLFPINEYTALSLCYDFVKLAWASEINNIQDQAIRKIISDRIDFIDGRFTEKAGHELVWSLVYHNFSARGFAVMLESVLDAKIDF